MMQRPDNTLFSDVLFCGFCSHDFLSEANLLTALIAVE